MKYKMIFSDLDDTLIDHNQNLGPKVKDAIKRYERAGGRFCIATGRMTVGVNRYIQELDLHGELITFQGAIVSDIDTKEILSSTLISKDEAIRIGTYIEQKGYYYQTYYGDKFYMQYEHKLTKYYAGLNKAEFVVTNEPLTKFHSKIKDGVPKLLVMCDEKDAPRIEHELKEEFGNDFLINSSKPFIVEIVPKLINKGKACEFVAKRHGIQMDEVICIGDSENDLKMLEVAGLSICVSSGSESVKKKVDYIAPSCDEDAVAFVIDKFGYID